MRSKDGPRMIRKETIVDQVLTFLQTQSPKYSESLLPICRTPRLEEELETLRREKRESEAEKKRTDERAWALLKRCQGMHEEKKEAWDMYGICDAERSRQRDEINHLQSELEEARQDARDWENEVTKQSDVYTRLIQGYIHERKANLAEIAALKEETGRAAGPV